jgi:hypothetical protein
MKLHPIKLLVPFFVMLPIIIFGYSSGWDQYHAELARGEESHSGMEKGKEGERNESNRSNEYNRSKESMNHPQAATTTKAYQRGEEQGASTSGGSSVYITPQNAYNPYAPENGGNSSNNGGWSQ